MSRVTTTGSRKTRRMRAIEAAHHTPIESLLMSLYYERGLTLAEIAPLLDVPQGTLAGWMIRFGINARAMAERGAQVAEVPA